MTHLTKERILSPGFVHDSCRRLGGAALSLYVNLELDDPEAAFSGKWADRINRLVAEKLQKSRSREINLMPGYNPDLLERVKSVYSHVQYWHGTGRYHLAPDGNKIDILESIASSGQIKPSTDVLTSGQNPIESISVAPSRMYARYYAERHFQRGKGLANAYGSLHFWHGVFGTSTAIEVFRNVELIKNGMYKPDFLIRDNARATRREHNEMRRVARGVERPGKELGSTISGNYPMLFGIREGAIEEPAEILEFLAKHETRSLEPIPLELLTHVEVPQEHVNETRAVLEANQVELSVIPMELGEEYVSQFPFTQLISGERLVT
jgi:hypothetical protein